MTLNVSSKRMQRALIFFLFFVLYLPTAFAQSSELEARTKKANELFEKENFAGALVELQEVLRLGGDPETLYKIAVCYKKLGDLHWALKLFDLYLTEDPNGSRKADAETQVKLIKKEIASGKSKPKDIKLVQAEKYNDKAEKSFNDAVKYRDIDAARSQDLFLDAAKQFLSSYAQDSDPAKLYFAAQAYRQGGDEPMATQYYEKFLSLATKNPKFLVTSQQVEAAKTHLATLKAISQDNFDRLVIPPLPDLPPALPKDIVKKKKKWPKIVIGVVVLGAAAGATVVLLQD